MSKDWFNVVNCETTVDIQKNTRTLKYSIVISSDEVPENETLPIWSTRGSRDRLPKPTVTQTQTDRVRFLIEEETGRRPEGTLDEWRQVEVDSIVQSDFFSPHLNDEVDQNSKPVCVVAKFVSTLDVNTPKIDSISDSRIKRDTALDLNDLTLDSVDIEMEAQESMRNHIQEQVEEAGKTAKGVKRSPDGTSIQFEATCNECGDPLGSDVDLGDKFCPDCLPESCRVDGCNEFPDDFHDHMIAEHGWYDPCLDPTTDEGDGS